MRRRGFKLHDDHNMRCLLFKNILGSLRDIGGAISILVGVVFKNGKLGRGRALI